jgi:hypothetical protein
VRFFCDFSGMVHQFKTPSEWKSNEEPLQVIVCFLGNKVEPRLTIFAMFPFQVAFFQSLGLSRSEVARMVERFPDLLTYSVEGNFRPKVNYLVNEMGRPVDDIVSLASSSTPVTLVARFDVVKTYPARLASFIGDLVKVDNFV